MKRLTLALCGAVVCASAFAGDANADFHKYMMSVLPKVEKAFTTGDVKFFDMMSTSDFSEKHGNQTMTKAQAMQEMKQSFAMMKSMKCSLHVLSTKVNGNKGIAMTSGHMTMVMKPEKPKGKSHTMVMDMWEKETWVRDGKGWKIQMIEDSKPMKMTMDGKSMDPSKMGG